MRGIRMVSSVLVVDPIPLEEMRLAEGFLDQGLEVWGAVTAGEAESVLKTKHPALVISELRFADGTWADILQAVRLASRGSRMVLATAQASIALTVRAIHSGVESVFAKPVTATQILDGLADETDLANEDAPMPGELTLDQAIWEYINRAVELRGSIAGAARSLGLERRWLQRMLVKYAPVSLAPLREGGSRRTGLQDRS